MAYLSSEIRNKIINKIENNISINQISRELNLAKSTIYHYYKKLKGKKFKDVKFNFNSDSELGEFLGIFSGDGNFFYNVNEGYKIRFFIGYYEKEYAYDLEKFFLMILSKRPSLWQKEKSVITLTYRSKKLSQFIKNYLTWEGKKTYSIQLSNLNHSKQFFIGFLKGLLDTDGSYNKSRNTIAFYTTSRRLDLQTRHVLTNILNLKFSRYIRHGENRKPLYECLLYGENARSILKILNPRNQNKRLTNTL